jgi:prepilin-type processing-associated H-X9-DG protein
MYKIRGADQKEYGPVNGDTLRQWIAQRRVDARTFVQAEGSSDWKPASELPELNDALAASGVAGPLPVASFSAPMPAAKTSGMAVASLVLGLLGFCTAGLTGLIGLPLGIVALIKISKSQGQRGGKGLAIAGVCVSGCVLLMLPVSLGLMLPALAKAKQKAQTIQCINNLKQLSLGVRLYANDNSDQYPPGPTWCDAVLSSVGNPTAFQCKDNPGQRSSFAFNQKLLGKKEAEVNPSTVMLFEFDGGWNVTGGPELLPNRSRHGRSINVAFADGSVRQVLVSDIGTLRWEP